MKTSHVGSFPLEFSLENVGLIAGDLQEIGVDVPPYPQLRNFVEIYMEPLVASGFVALRGESYFLNKSLQVEDVVFESRIEEAEVFVDRARSLGFKGLRAPVTGPFTLSSEVLLAEGGGLESTGIANADVVRTMARYVNSVLKYMERLGYNYLFIDEPILGVIVGTRRLLFGWGEGDIADVIETVFKGIGGYHGIHVCGRVSKRLFDLLVGVPVLDFLNFEFHDSPENTNIVNGEILSSKGKVLAPGVASSKRPEVESVEEIKGLLRELLAKARGRVDLVSADCGFGGLSTASGSRRDAYEVALKKLANIKKAVLDLS
ncbi:Methionine synthase II (cobalamin-independent)-like protein [Thermogladius calderae 1633]|uniref:Methionine synthase II (Cobalamin-independent)-like protein n=1 Tax=Thermogladius calderae (strain DSM 22663 / VKM B-2946 / 1633) TaxID=1184251 RepID=I3TEC7_THEC1|nr:methionine synthase II (cobalamin-independent)-like protein [Thermogladius calderae]AFK51115.1 Methionine synthase II (cobalamin-independent)-like protein [Thermogladius calderae 1633]